MNDARVGRGLRAVRQRLGWRQRDVATRSGVSQQGISRAERGQLDRMPLRKIRQIAAALDVDIDVAIRWRGGALDRLLDERHASLVGATTKRLVAAGWSVVPEVTYSQFGERGSVDLLAFEPVTRTILVIEVKTEIGSVELTVRKHDEKVRLASSIARERLGWSAARTARLLILPADSTPRRQVARHGAIFDRAYPLRGAALSAWLQRPDASIAGLLFLSTTQRVSGGRVRVTRSGRQEASIRERQSTGTRSTGSLETNEVLITRGLSG